MNNRNVFTHTSGPAERTGADHEREQNIYATPPPPEKSRNNTASPNFRAAFPVKFILAALGFLLLSITPVSAQTIINVDSGCSLLQAIREANGETTNVGSCEAGTDGAGAAGHDIIIITANIDLTANLPEIDGRNGNVTIRGVGGRHTIDGKGSHKIFDFDYLGGGKVENLTLVGSNGPAVGISQCCLNGGGSLEVTNVVVRNTSTRAGHANAAINAGSGTNILTISNSAIYNNQTNGIFGGSQSTITIVNSSIFGNTGDGIREGAQSAEFRLRHVTVTGNSGIGLNMQGGDALNVRNSIIYGNTGKDCAIGYSGTEVSVRGSIIGASADDRCKTGQSTRDPLLAASSMGSPPYYALLSGSPAINAAACIVGVDQRGVSRPQGCSCDIGAYEFEEAPCPDAGGISFSYEISCENRLHKDVTAPYAIFPCDDRLDFYWIDASSRGHKQFSLPTVNALISSGQAGGQLIQTTHPGNSKPVVATWLPEAQQIEISAYYTDKPSTNQIDKPYLIRIDSDFGVTVGTAAAAAAARDLTDCMVTTTHILNFRSGPGGAIQGLLPYNVTLTAMARTADWFQVDYHGAQGWISADYVIPQGDCG